MVFSTVEVKFNGSTYIIESIPLKYDEAQNACKEIGANLAPIFDESTNFFLSNSFISSNITDFWTGGKTEDGIEWTWTLSTYHFNYTSWDISEPKKSPNKSCLASSTPYGKWSSQDCEKEKPYVCKMELSLQHISINDKGFEECPMGWFYASSTKSCIGLSYTRQNKTIITDWESAERHCNSFMAHLPSIHNIQEFRIIQNYIIFAQQSIWLGLKYGTNNQWAWSDNSKVDFLPWYFEKGYPTNMDISCGRADLSFMTNQNCNSAAAILCKMPAFFSNVYKQLY
uniref:C-type lectin domain-containing protein n=1 Tax=Panagrolaimus sp. ES5 TaxID=591445 RepID=A0AC34FDN6_9BILA